MMVIMNRDQDLFIYDVALQELTRINENADGNRIDTNGSAFSADLSGDGRFVSFNAMNEWGHQVTFILQPLSLFRYQINMLGVFILKSVRMVVILFFIQLMYVTMMLK